MIFHEMIFKKALFKFVEKKNAQILNEKLKYQICDWNTFRTNCTNLYDSLKDGQVFLNFKKLLLIL